MIVKDNIISIAMLKLGEVNYYNDNQYDMRKIADKLLDNVILNIAVRNDFLFNSRTVKLTLNLMDKNENTGEYRYNLPTDFLNKIRFLNDPSARIENEFIYSTKKDLLMQYCYKMSLSDYPDYLQNYMIYALATEMAETYNKYIDRLSFLNQRLEEEKTNVYRIEWNYIQREM